MSRRRAQPERPIGNRQDRPVDFAASTTACAECGAAVGVWCRFEISGVMHDGAHRARIDAAYATAATPSTRVEEQRIEEHW